MKILLAGGAGYIGSSLVPQLLEHGYEIEVIDLLWFGNHLPENVKVIQKDLFTCKEEDFKGYEQVIFLGGLSNDPMAEFDPPQNFISNGALPSFLAFIAKKAGVRRFIYASSCSIYGYAANKLYQEDDPVTCDYPYGISKLQGERGVMQLQDENFSVIALRQGTICGFSPRMRFDLIINTMFMNAMTKKELTVNNPSIWRPIYDLRDAVSAYIRSIQAEYSISGVYNVTSANYTVGQVGDYVKDELERLAGIKVKLNILNKHDFRNYKVSYEKAQTELGFNPRYGVTEIIHNLFDHLDYYGDFSNDEFYNIKALMKMKSK